MPEEILALAAPDIIIAGRIEDLRTLFDPCLVFVCPLRVGAGVKGKIASAMSYGIPIVTTQVGIEGTDLAHEAELLVAETPDDFAAQVLRLCTDEALWQRLSAQSQAAVRRAFSPEMGAQALAHAVETAFAHRLGVPDISGKNPRSISNV
jgi:glycosyltransferase involved in cell wall biosynthesis